MSQLLVTGATGYIGGRLVPELLDAGHDVRCLVRTPSKLVDVDWSDRVDIVEGDIGDADAVARAMDGCAAAYFLVHSMGGDDDFAAQDRHHAEVFAVAAESTPTMEQIVYLGGLGDDDDDLSPHLESRHEVGRILRRGRVPVTELRAAVIIGSGSASFEMLRNLVEVLPVMVTPRWVDTRVQPIAIRDILHALTTVLDRPDARGQIVQVGGPDVLTYREMMHTYADVAGLRKRWIVPVPVLSPGLSSRWVGLVTPLPRDLAAPLVESLVNEVVVSDDADVDLFDGRERIGFRRSIELALRRIESIDVHTRWSDAALPGSTPADPLPSDPDWSGGTAFVDTQRSTAVDADAAQALRGGQRHRRCPGLVRRRSALDAAGSRRQGHRRSGHAAGPTPPRRPPGRRCARLLAGRGPRPASPAAPPGRDAPAGRGVARVGDRHGRRGRCDPHPTSDLRSSGVARSPLLVLGRTVPPIDLPPARRRDRGPCRGRGGRVRDVIRRLFRLVFLAGIAAGVVAVVRAMTNKDDPLPSPAGAPDGPWPPLRNETAAPKQPTAAAAPEPAVVPEPAGVPVAGASSGWVEPTADGSCPAGHPVKAKLKSKIFHEPGQLNYDRTTPDRCYVDAAAAEADGLRAAKR